MLFHLLRLLAALLLPRSSVRQSGKSRFFLTVAVTLALSLIRLLNNVVLPLLFHVRKIDPLFRTLPVQIRETGKFRDGVVAITAIDATAVIPYTGM